MRFVTTTITHKYDNTTRARLQLSRLEKIELRKAAYQRAQRWTEKTHEWEAGHYRLCKAIMVSIILAIPAGLLAALLCQFWR